MTLRVPKAELPAELRESMALRVNTAHGITSQDYSAACDIPLAEPQQHDSTAPAQ
jgi:hypothetical protein